MSWRCLERGGVLAADRCPVDVGDTHAFIISLCPQISCGLNGTLCSGGWKV